MNSILNSTNSKPSKSPLEDPKHPDILFPIDNLKTLLSEIGWDYSKWIDFWLEQNGQSLAKSYWPKGTRLDWVWGLGLPFISDVRNCYNLNEKRPLFGISALPGCGKTSFGKWLEASAKEIGISLKVLSLDDFYLPSSELELAMKNNPWNVPRGLPGSHSINLLEDTIGNWRSTGCLYSPQFDKSLRNGLGDRSGWISSSPDVLVLEGWFLGCFPIKKYLRKNLEEDILIPGLSQIERDYREKVQRLLINYRPIWEKIDRIWHIKATDFASTTNWKIAQEKEMLDSKGSALTGSKLISFVRMIHAAIPQHSLMKIDCNAILEINNDRQILNIINQFRENV